MHNQIVDTAMSIGRHPLEVATQAIEIKESWMSLLPRLPGRQPANDPRSLDRDALMRLGATVDARISAGERGLRSLNNAERVALFAYWRATGRGSVMGAFLHGLKGRSAASGAHRE
jgi:hypothetical protein